MLCRSLILLLGIVCWPASLARSDDASRSPLLQITPYRVVPPAEGSDPPFVESAPLPAAATAEAAPAQAQQQALRLAPPRARVERADPPPPQSPARALTTVLSSLALVVGLFLLVVWVTRRAMPKASQSLPSDVIEILGRAQLTPRQPMHLIRLGRKLILVSLTPSGVETITEVTEPAEVDHLLGLCQQNKEGSVSSSFRTALAQLGQEAPRGGFFGGS